MNPKIKMDNLTGVSLYRKFSISFVLMSMVPIVLMLYIIHYFNIMPLLEQQIPLFQLTILLVVLLSLASFDLIRRSMVSLTKFSKRATDIAAGNYDKRVEESKEEELGQLAKSFNKITSELQDKINQLEESKRLLHNILNKVGSAVTSTKGIENLLELILQTLVTGTDAIAGAIFLTDMKTNDVSMKVNYGLPKDIDTKILDCKKGLLGRVIEYQKPEVASDVSTNAAAYFEFKNNLANDSIMAAPLVYQKDVLGAIIICDKKGKKPFDRDDINLLSNVCAQTAIAVENFILNKDAEETYLETIMALAVAVEAKDPYSKGHIDRVTQYSQKLGEALNLDEAMMKTLASGAMLHDVGKIGVRDEVLKKQGVLNDEELKEMREHVIIGVNIIKPIKSMSALSDLVRHHQELYDGSGYPDGLKGEEIPLTARIIKVCDAYDAMTTDRPYRKGMSKEAARQEMIAKSGKDFDPKIIEKFLEII
jgi:HD-GYP domain-containing protein (c-di-GMP phosphodiesterase class II)/HAMP domain-containing protein